MQVRLKRRTPINKLLLTKCPGNTLHSSTGYGLGIKISEWLGMGAGLLRGHVSTKVRSGVFRISPKQPPPHQKIFSLKIKKIRIM